MCRCVECGVIEDSPCVSAPMPSFFPPSVLFFLFSSSLVSPTSLFMYIPSLFPHTLCSIHFFSCAFSTSCATTHHQCCGRNSNRIMLGSSKSGLKENYCICALCGQNSPLQQSCHAAIELLIQLFVSTFSMWTSLSSCSAIKLFRFVRIGEYGAVERPCRLVEAVFAR